MQAARVSDPPKKKSGQTKTQKGRNHEEARTTVDFLPTRVEMETHETEAKAISVPLSHRALMAGKEKPHQDDLLPETIEETETRIISFGGEDHSDEMEDRPMLDLDMEHVPLPPRNCEDLHDMDRHVNEMKETREEGEIVDPSADLAQPGKQNRREIIKQREMPDPGQAAIKILQSKERKPERNMETSVLNPQDGWAIAGKE